MIGTPIPCHDKPEMIEQQYLLWYLGAVERDKSKLATRNYAQQRNMATLWWVLGENHLHIQKLVLSTTLTQTAKKAEQKLPPQYTKYTKIFDEPKDGKLSPWQPFNHAIDLKGTFIPKVAKTYPMNPKEMEACKEFINEHLKFSKIQKSQSPQASPFFFIQKKDGGLCPCQDYQHLNEHTIRNAYPLPLISTLIDKLKGAKYFPRWTYNGGIITSTSKKETSGRLHSSPLMVSTNHWSCSLDSATPYQPSKPSWTQPLGTW